MIFVKSGQQSSWESFVVTINYDYADVGDVYYQAGIPIGIIGKKRDNGQNGMLLSCVESDVSSLISWSGTPKPTDWLTYLSGLDNQWKIPTVEELTLCFNNIVNVGWEQVNASLKNLGFQAISNKIWSSIQNTSGNYAIVKCVSNNVSSEYVSPMQTCSVRAIRTF